ncbi:M949_RS01915 family surface polysaccharide biosynthesis protein [Formosa undariae]|uniref:M949_RS01915 family surface polysaccharide biosynthesis protein n=1 Tax=Formosa undariae TaxID=1325436 RepID=A0ABV5F0W4_9FLAO
MKKKLILLLTLLFSLLGFGQDSTISSKQLNEQEIDSVFTDVLKTKLQIKYSIYSIYEYNDKLGKHFIVMTENEFECNEKEQYFNAIEAFCFSYKDGLYKLAWSLKDFILPEGNEVSKEYSISFWTKYFELKDYNDDGIVDPIMVYGTFGMNGTSDGRIKILAYHKGIKKAIRHQNGTLDFERKTKVDNLYYDLPKGIQNRVHQIMESITENNHGIFPNNWQHAMENKKLKFDEN